LIDVKIEIKIGTMIDPETKDMVDKRKTEDLTMRTVLLLRTFLSKWTSRLWVSSSKTVEIFSELRF
jgi:hypothetical protein